MALNHGINGIKASNADSREGGLGAGELIDRYFLPTGELPHASLATRALSAAGLELVDAESLRPHYALTLRHWSNRFEAQLPTLEALAGPQRTRIWRIDLAGCAHGFARGWINIYQLLAIRSNDGRCPLPLTRRDLYATAVEPAQTPHERG